MAHENNANADTMLVFKSNFRHCSFVLGSANIHHSTHFRCTHLKRSQLLSCIASRTRQMEHKDENTCNIHPSTFTLGEVEFTRAQSLHFAAITRILASLLYGHVNITRSRQRHLLHRGTLPSFYRRSEPHTHNDMSPTILRRV